jgi:hypothetical protein
MNDCYLLFVICYLLLVIRYRFNCMIDKEAKRVPLLQKLPYAQPTLY